MSLYCGGSSEGTCMKSVVSGLEFLVPLKPCLLLSPIYINIRNKHVNYNKVSCNMKTTISPLFE